MRHRQSRRYRRLPMLFTAVGLGFILLGGVVATPGRVPDAQTTANVGLVADNTSAAVAPNADFVRTRAQALDMLDATVAELQSSSSRSARTAAGRLEAIAARLSVAAPNEPDELEAIVAALKHERASKLIRRLRITVPSDTWRPVITHRRGERQENEVEPEPSPPPVEEVVDLLGRIIDIIAELIERLFPPPPYVPPQQSRPHH